MRWKNAKWGMFIANLYAIVPNCLRVERAITFFISHSAIAANPATQAVIEAANKRINSSVGIVFSVG